jgi:hypothetical protein
MKKFFFSYYIELLILIFAFIFVSCQQQPIPSQQITSQADMDSFHYKAVYSYPKCDNVSELLRLIRDLDIIFVEDAVNDFENTDKYTRNDNLTAANMGVYMSDMVYAWICDEEDISMHRNMAALSLADHLKMADVFLDSFFDKYNKEDIDPDTILILFEHDLNETIRQLPEEKNLELYSAVLTGSFIEKLHMVFEMIKNCPEISNSPDLILENLQKLVWIANGQAKALEDLNKQIDSYQIPEESRLVHGELVNLNTMMQKAVFLNDTSMVRSINMINDQEFLALYQEVNKIRGYIINPAE